MVMCPFMHCRLLVYVYLFFAGYFCCVKWYWYWFCLIYSINVGQRWHNLIETHKEGEESGWKCKALDQSTGRLKPWLLHLLNLTIYNLWIFLIYISALLFFSQECQHCPFEFINFTAKTISGFRWKKKMGGWTLVTVYKMKFIVS